MMFILILKQNMIANCTKHKDVDALALSSVHELMVAASGIDDPDRVLDWFRDR